MKFHDFSPFYRSGEGIRSKVAGDRLIDNPAVADAQGGSGASFDFTGVSNDAVLVSASSESVDIFDGGGSATCWVYARSTTSGRIVLKDGNGTAGGWNLQGYGNSGTHFYFDFLQYFSGDDGRWITPENISLNEWHHLAVTYDNGSASNLPTLYVDGVAQAVTASSTPTGTRGSDSGYAIYVGNRQALARSWDGQISQVRLHNRALSADEVRASYNGQAVGFEYRGASQDELITNGDMEADSDWGDNGSPTTNERSDEQEHGGTYSRKFVGSGSTNDGIYTGAIGVGLSVVAGKTYRWSAWVYSSTGNVSIYAFKGETEWAVEPDTSTAVRSVTTNTWTYVTDTYVADQTGSLAHLAITSGPTGTGTYYVDDVSLTQIGCVAEYLPESISDSTWLDSSGNELDGSVSGATAVNAEAGIVGRDSHLLESKTVADLQTGASFKFDGVNDFVYTTDDSITPSPSASVEAWFKTVKNSGQMTIVGSGRSWSGNTMDFTINVLNGEIMATNWRQSGTSSNHEVTGLNVADGQWHHVASTYVDGLSNTGVNKIYVDGVLVSTDNAIKTFASGTGLEPAEIDIGATTWGGLYYFDGEISGVKYHNRALSAAEVRAAYNGQAVPYEYVGGSQDEQTSGTLTIGKSYRLKDWITSDDFTNVGAASNADGVEFTATGTTPTTWSNSSKVVQIGCVAEYLPSGINGNTDGTNPSWVDTSGNNLHGTTSTATAVNHEVGAITTVGDIRIGSGSGISFSPYDDAVTGPPGSDSNLLDDYEEGTWTPTATNMSLTLDDGKYTKIGGQVTISFNLEGTAGTPDGSSFLIGGLPFDPANNSADRVHCALLYRGFNFSATATSVIGLVATLPYVYVYEVQDAGAWASVTDSILTGTSGSISMQGSFTYFV